MSLRKLEKTATWKMAEWVGVETVDPMAKETRPASEWREER
jgi:hypothetical protein